MSDKVVESYQQACCNINAIPVPDGPSATKQQSWENTVMEREFAILKQYQVDDFIIEGVDF